MIVYHGSNSNVEHPDHTKGRSDTDFGQGFYATAAEIMAQKWAARKSSSVINVYDIDFAGLKVKKLKLDEEWLGFVIANRQMEEPDVFNGYDVIIGATADDKMFSTIENYENGYISGKDAIKILNNMDIGIQMCFRTQKAVDKLTFVKSYALSEKQKSEFKSLIREERKKANELTSKMMREAVNRREKLDISDLTTEEQKEIKKMVSQKRKARRNKENEISL